MLFNRHSAWILGVSLCALMPAIQAETTFAQPRSFILDKDCPAFTSLKKKTNAENLAVGSKQAAIGENKPDGATHALLQLPSGHKWVELTCGHYTDATPASTTAPNTPATAPTNSSQCLPFFDNQDNPVKIKIGNVADITPPAPALNEFDNAVNKACGKPGKVVAPAEFKAMMNANTAVLQRVFAYTQGKVFADRPARTTLATYLDDLTEAWFAVHAFDHIMCGEPEAGGPIGGMHFVGRYEQLQQTGEACRMDNYRQNEVVPGVLYSMGAIMKLPNGGIARSSIKGYGLTLNAEDIVKGATKAFSENPTTKQDSTACILPVSDNGKRFSVVFVRRATGIRTFYPDATPDTREAVCNSPIVLP